VYHKITNRKLNLLALIIIYLAIICEACDRSIFIECADTTKKLSDKELLIILPGLGGGGGERRKIRRFFQNRGYDVYIADYISRKSVEESVENLKKGINDIRANEYNKVHFFTYIMGSWTLNLYLQKYKLTNLSTIVYDRSPLQERAPGIAAENLKVLSRILLGKVVKDLAQIDYPPVNKKGIRIGLIIENRATPLMRLFKKKTLQMGSIYWEVDSLHQEYNDYYYTWLNHDQMYDKVDIVGNEVLHFISHGAFSPKARKRVYEGDPFKKYREKQ